MIFLDIDWKIILFMFSNFAVILDGANNAFSRTLASPPAIDRENEKPANHHAYIIICLI